MTYEDLLIQSDNEGLKVKEKNIQGNDGRIFGNRIAIRRKITQTEKACVLAEELGHYHTTVGDILNQKLASNRKQEQLAGLWAYNHLIGLYGIVNCYKFGCQSLHDMAEHLDVSEDFFK